MSDTDDGFDEEAVRRELREKYEDDDRAETERMSELLLQGATMTNQHCETCGSPIFRYDGQSFCPNCQHAGGQQAREQQAGGQQGGGQQAGEQQPGGQPQGGERQPGERADAGDQRADAGPAGQQADSTSQPAPADSDAPGDDAPSDDAPRADAPSDDADAASHAAGDAGRRQPPSQADESGSRGRLAGGEQPRQAGGSRSAGAPSGEAAAALESSIAALARRAASSDDPRRAREYLEAAREAADALAALRPGE